MNVPQADLDDLATRAEAIRATADAASSYLRNGETDLAGGSLTELSIQHIPGLQSRLMQLGAQSDLLPGYREVVPLHLLDTSSNRLLFHRLCQAAAAASEVDAERGVEDGGGVFHLLQMLADHVRLEVEGPAGSGE